MQKQLKIEIVSDVSCPWCIIGYKSLSQALTQLAPQASAHIAWKPFELNPGMTAAGQQMTEHLHEKYGSTKAEIEQTRKMISARGAALGFQFNFKDDGRIYNTFNAHRLLYWARQFDKQTELKLALFGLYFTEGGNPGNNEELIKTVVKVGLLPEEARKVLESEQFATEVRAEEAKYMAMGINMVPTFIINDKYVITGGMPVEDFAAKLEQIVGETGKF
jgi:predicted DsbA family dithiol-disulfide isomerase